MKIENKIIQGLPRTTLRSKSIIVAHDSGNPNNTGPDSLDNEVAYMTRAWRNAFVSHWVGGGGRIVQTAHTGYVQWGAGIYANPIAYAQVELARTKDKETFKKDYKAYVALLRALAKEAGIPIHLDAKDSRGIKSHEWVSDNLGGTDHRDPYAYLSSFGISKAQFAKDIKDGIGADVIISTPVSKPKPTPTPSKPKGLVEDGYWGKATTEALQKLFGTHIDGIISGQLNNQSVRNIPSARTGNSGSTLIKAMQKWVGTPVDGKISAKSLFIETLQKRLKTPVDGKVSYPSTMVKAMQKAINNGTFKDVVKGTAKKPTTTSKPAPKKYKVAVDGYMGKGTVKALQQYFGSKADGVISGQYSTKFNAGINKDAIVTVGQKTGSTVIKHLQRKVGSKVDGHLGKNTIMALQKYLGTHQDGIIGRPSQMVKELQRRLANGTF